MSATHVALSKRTAQWRSPVLTGVLETDERRAEIGELTWAGIRSVVETLSQHFSGGSIVYNITRSSVKTKVTFDGANEMVVVIVTGWIVKEGEPLQRPAYLGDYGGGVFYIPDAEEDR